MGKIAKTNSLPTQFPALISGFGVRGSGFGVRGSVHPQSRALCLFITLLAAFFVTTTLAQAAVEQVPPEKILYGLYDYPLGFYIYNTPTEACAAQLTDGKAGYNSVLAARPGILYVGIEQNTSYSYMKNCIFSWKDFPFYRNGSVAPHITCPTTTPPYTHQSFYSDVRAYSAELPSKFVWHLPGQLFMQRWLQSRSHDDKLYSCLPCPCFRHALCL